MKQMSIFDGKEPFKIDKPIRLIELFAGYGSQSLALEYMGVPFESHKICEWAIPSIQAYKDLHCGADNTDYSRDLTFDELVDYLTNAGVSADYNQPLTRDKVKRLGEKQCRNIYNNIKATHNLVSVCNCHGKDFEIIDTDKYCYIMTYSFPCQDLSLCGLGRGMAKDSGTRSGLLWEVERLLDEMTERPQVLLCENVPQVHGSGNVQHFAKWIEKLESLGYHCYWQDLNAKNYGVPQNRDRCFIVSLLGDYDYEFPQGKPLTLRLKDLLETNVDEKYYLFEYDIKRISSWKAQQKPLEHILDDNSICQYITARGAGEDHSGMILYGEPNKEPLRVVEPKREQVAQLQGKGYNEMTGRAYASNGIAPTCRTCSGGNTETKIAEPIIYDDYNGKIKSDQSCIGTLTTNCGAIAERNGTKIAEPFIREDFFATVREPREYHETSSTLRADRIGLEVCEPTELPVQNYRIRKLTPRECFRLMGVKDTDFDKIAQRQSNSKLYHLAGDSIVVDVLMAIFKEMLWNAHI